MITDHLFTYGGYEVGSGGPIACMVCGKDVIEHAVTIGGCIERNNPTPEIDLADWKKAHDWWGENCAHSEITSRLVPANIVAALALYRAHCTDALRAELATAKREIAMLRTNLGASYGKHIAAEHENERLRKALESFPGFNATAHEIVQFAVTVNNVLNPDAEVAP